ncbi:type II toxin-antitoxin system VapC family toxin [Candidatus Bathyarchaeota archaeon]|nr:type II toxin-antitoxin system VapC family toxin [Candidatus Bathyarchaeota archaeon]
MKFYLDSSAIVKRYVLEEGSDKVKEIYFEAFNGAATLHFSVWNVGEVLGALDTYYRRNWLEGEDYRVARESFIAETVRLLKLNVAKVVPVRSRLLAESWLLVEKHHIYEADALQIVSVENLGVDQLLSGDQRLVDISNKEEVNAAYLG